MSLSPNAPVLYWPDVERATAPTINWLWDGYVAPGNLTLLASQWKAGKTLLLSVLLARLKAGGEVAGRAVRPGRALVISEEGPEHWRQRGHIHDFSGHVAWVCRPFPTKPTLAQWQGLLDQAADLHSQSPIDLLAIDPLAAVLPGRDENNAGSMLEALMPLHRLAGLGMAVLLLHHTRKASSADGRAARGSGALTGFVDVLMELHYRRSAMDFDRRRKLLAWSRFERTPRQQVIELSEDGRRYDSLGDLDAESFSTNYAVLESVLTRAKQKLSRKAILEKWPEGHDAPDEVVLWRWLTRGVNSGRIKREGSGHKNDSFKYWLPEAEERWRNDPMRFDDLVPLPPLDDW